MVLDIDLRKMTVCKYMDSESLFVIDEALCIDLCSIYRYIVYQYNNRKGGTLVKKKILVGLCMGAVMISASAFSVWGAENLTTKLCSIDYPSNWKYAEDYMYDNEGYTDVIFFIGESSSNYDTKVQVNVEEENARNFRESLIARDITMESYADGSVEKATFNGIEYAVSGPNFNNKAYMYRDEAAGVTVSLVVSGNLEEETVDDLLNGITLNLTDEGLTDPPWPWEGTPFTATLTPQMIGTFTITPEAVPFEESKAVRETMEHQFIKIGNMVYHLLKEELNVYDDSTGVLTYVSTIALDRDCEFLTTDQTGMIYLSPGILPIFGVKDGQKALQTEVKGDLFMHPSGEWGLTSWVNSDTQKVINQNGVLTAEPWILTGMTDDAARQGIFKSVQELAITDSHILVAGTLAEKDAGSRVAVYDYDGNQLLTLGSNDISQSDCIGHITGLAETANGFVAADGNMRDLYFWTKEGTFIGAVSMGDLLGTSYPWIEDMQLLEDGSLLLAVTQEREDKSSYELLFFKVTGF